MQTNGLGLIENTVTVVLSERKVVNEGLKAAEDLIVCRCALVLPWSFDAAPRGIQTAHSCLRALFPVSRSCSLGFPVLKVVHRRPEIILVFCFFFPMCPGQLPLAVYGAWFHNVLLTYLKAFRCFLFVGVPTVALHFLCGLELVEMALLVADGLLCHGVRGQAAAAW